MDRPDTIIELHRAVVQKLAAADLPPKERSTPVGGGQSDQFEGTAKVNVSLSRVWFMTDENGRVWSEEAGTPDEDRERHFAIDLRLANHPAEINLPDSKVVVTKVRVAGVMVPAPTSPSTSCQGKTIQANEIPLLGRLTIHERLDRIDTQVDGKPAQHVVLDFAPQSSPALRSTAPGVGVDTRLLGPKVTQASDGSATLSAGDPRIVWELTRAEQRCILDSTLGALLVTQELSNPIGTTRAVAEDRVLKMIAGKLVDGVSAQLQTIGEDQSSVVDVLPEPVPVDPTGETEDTRELDARVKAWNRPNGDPGESLVFQLQTVDADGLAVADPPPESVLALRDQEEVGFSRSGWAILRSLRRSQIKSLCLKKDASQFKPGEPCELKKSVGIEVNDEDADLKRFRAWLEADGAVGEELLHVEGRAEGGNWAYGWYIQFELVYRLGRGEVPRDAVGTERARPGGTLEEINARLAELQEQKCARTGDRDAIKEEIKELNEQKRLPPQSIGVKPTIHGEPVTSSDGWITTAGWIAGIAIAALLAGTGIGLVAVFATKAALIATAVAAVIFMGAVVGTMVFLHAEYLDVKVDAGLQKFVNDKRDPGGDKIPLDGYQPIHLEMNGSLNVYLEEMPASMRVLWREPDTPLPVGDPDYITQMVAGKLPGEDRIWVLTVNDAVRYIEKGRLELSVQNGAGPVEVHVATSSRGRKYLRTDPDVGGQNNLRALPPVPL